MKFVILCLAVMSLLLAAIPHLAYLVAKVVALGLHRPLSYRPFGIAALVLCLLWFILFAWGNVFGRFRYEVKTLDFSHRQIPEAFDGFRIVHISDLHAGGWIGHEDKLSALIAEINGLHPDVICFTGDLENLTPDDVRPLIPTLRQLNAPHGIISVLGNHDYTPYKRFSSPRQREEALQEIIRIERENLGWTLLLNENIILHRGSDSLAIIGTENQSMGAHAVIQRGDLRKAMQGTEGMARILLTHDPTHWRGEVIPQTDIPLTLSGHTHAMQMRIGNFTPSRWIYPECDGLYTHGDQHLYVNIGLGGSMPMRIGATPEITLITLHPAE